ncbi:Cathepsin B [Cleaved into: Cathepsin B light chain, partial [Durusdinium trenchii]
VKEMLPSLGTEMGPLKLPLRSAPASFLRNGSSPPESFDARAHWPKCNSIGLIRNQGPCGSCWAVAAATVMTDRFCVAAMQHQSWMQIAASDDQLEDLEALCLSPELMVQCDDTNNGCGGGRLDDAWIFLKNHGIPK